MKRTFFFFFFLLWAGYGYWASAYDIKGYLDLDSNWQDRLFLASINSPENLFVASPNFIINETVVGPDGFFDLSGQDLPDDPRFYRLYVVRNNVYAADFMSDTVRNFMHLILTNKTELEIRSHEGKKLFENMIVKGSDLNQQLNSFESVYFRKQKVITHINTVAKRDFQSQRLNKYIRDFVINARNPILGLFAVYHIEDRETDFLRNSKFYFNFQTRLKSVYPRHIYTNAYDNLLTNLVDYRNLVCEIPRITKPWRGWAMMGEGLVILVLLFLLLRQKRSSAAMLTIDYNRLLTDKEQKIWESLSRGMTNKEIAAELFIELSTVKTHINNLYKRLGVSNRHEASDLYKQFKRKSQ